MGMPSITVRFTEAARSFVTRAERAVVGLILKGTVPSTNPVVITRLDEISECGLDANGKKHARRAMLGCDGVSPTKVICYVVPANAENYNAAFTYFDTVKTLNYIAIPGIVAGEKQAVADWITAQRAEYKVVKAVLPDYAGDSTGIINYITAQVTSGDETFSAADYCSRIAGLIAACPPDQAVTYKALMELDGCTKMSRVDMDTAIDEGKLLVFWDGEKVKIARGVNSLVSTTATMGDQFKKIHVVDIMDMILADIKRTAEDNYIGRYTNSYDNKCLLLTAVGNYLADLERQQLIRLVNLDIDIDANRSYLISQGIDVSDMSDQDLKEAATGSKVFLTATINIYDAIEDIVLPITV